MSEETRIILVNNITPHDYIKVSNNFHRLEKEIARLINIIKEAREYIEIKFFDGKYKYELLEILDKVGSDKE